MLHYYYTSGFMQKKKNSVSHTCSKGKKKKMNSDETVERCCSFSYKWSRKKRDGMITVALIFLILMTVNFHKNWVFYEFAMDQIRPGVAESIALINRNLSVLFSSWNVRQQQNKSLYTSDYFFSMEVDKCDQFIRLCTVFFISLLWSRRWSLEYFLVKFFEEKKQLKKGNKVRILCNYTWDCQLAKCK